MLLLFQLDSIVQWCMTRLDVIEAIFVKKLINVCLLVYKYSIIRKSLDLNAKVVCYFTEIRHLEFSF